MTDALASGGNVTKSPSKNPVTVKNLHVQYLIANGKAARLLKAYVDAAVAVGLTHTGVIKYRRFPARIFMFSFTIRGSVTHVDSYKAACEDTLARYRKHVRFN